MTPDDMTLVREFAATQSEPAFTAVVERHLALVHSAALRQTGDAHLAEEISQAVFILLARKAASLGRNTILPAWLYRATRYAASNALKIQRRRQAREQEAYMQSTGQTGEPDAAWQQLAPVLDDAMAGLAERDRAAVVLRYFENRPWQEVAALLQMTEDAAQKRVTRALEKLRQRFAKLGVKATAGLIAVAVAANSAPAAPAGLVKTVSAAAVAKGAAASTSTLTLVKGALKIMAWTKAKSAVVMLAGVLLATGTTTAIVKQAGRPKITEAMWMVNDIDGLKKLPPTLVLRPSHFDKTGGVNRDGKYVYRDKPFFIIWSMAYAPGASTRSIHWDLLPEPGFDWSKPAAMHFTNGFDLMLTLTNQPEEKLRREIKRQLGLIAHTEVIETNVLLLKVKKFPAPGLSYGNKNAHAFNVGGWSGEFNYELTNAPDLGNLASFLEGIFVVPVLDETGLHDLYNITMTWDQQEFFRRMLKRGGGQSMQIQKEMIREALSDQLGLELIPTNAPIEMLVIEKVK